MCVYRVLVRCPTYGKRATPPAARRLPPARTSSGPTHGIGSCTSTCTVYTVQTVVWYWYEYILVYIRYVQRAACKNYTVQRHRRGPDTGGTTKFMEYMIWKRRENTREATPARHNARLCLRLAGRPKCVPGGGHVLVGNHPSERDELTRALG